MTETTEERFRRKYAVDQASGCWLWTGLKDRRGYGKLHLSRTEDPNHVPKFAHRWSYEQHVGPIPAGLVLDHLCRNPGCVNPDHLEPVTVQENLARGAGAGQRLWDGKLPPRRHATHCPQGHPYTPENTVYDPGKKCRICRTERARKRYDLKRKPKATHCPHGHEWTPENTYVSRSTGYRSCRTCVIDAQRRLRERKKAASPEVSSD